MEHKLAKWEGAQLKSVAIAVLRHVSLPREDVYRGRALPISPADVAWEPAMAESARRPRALNFSYVAERGGHDNKYGKRAHQGE